MALHKKQAAAEALAAAKNAVPPPREMAVIQTEHDAFIKQLGIKEYMIKCMKSECQQIAQALVGINQEANERQKLDQAKALEDAKNAPVAPVAAATQPPAQA